MIPHKLKQALDEAVLDGVISVDQAQRLGQRLSGQFAGEQPAPAGTRTYPGHGVPDTEVPRFLRGFHDVLVSIGILAALLGLELVQDALPRYLTGGLAFSPIGLLAVVLLSELLVARQRLALPAVVLTLALLGYAVALGMQLGGNPSDLRGTRSANELLTIAVVVAAAQAAYAWRYRVPLARALMLAALVVTGGELALVILAVMVSPDTAASLDTTAMPWIGLVAACVLFGLAVRYDLADPRREDGRSDTAFWLHLMAAPALLYSLLWVLLFAQRPAGAFELSGVREPVVTLTLVAVLMAVGLLLDRRAFVTGGLIALGVALTRLLGATGADLGLLGAFSLIAVGVIVLLLGTGWEWLRARMLDRLPPFVAERLPPPASRRMETGIEPRRG